MNTKNIDLILFQAFLKRIFNWRRGRRRVEKVDRRSNCNLLEHHPPSTSDVCHRYTQSDHSIEKNGYEKPRLAAESQLFELEAPLIFSKKKENLPWTGISSATLLRLLRKNPSVRKYIHQETKRKRIKSRIGRIFYRGRHLGKDLYTLTQT